MVYVSPQFCDTLRSQVLLSDVVGRTVRLQRRNNEFSGLCPFHKEKSPSFTVNDDKGFYHCFGCGAHGDVIRFISETQNLSFPESVQRLAEEAGIEIPAEMQQSKKEHQQYDAAYAVMEKVCQWFEQQLKGPAGYEARQYVANRQISEEQVRAFRLGYAPDQWHGLESYLKQQNVNVADAARLGVLRHKAQGKYYDYFRDRIIFPILDNKGRVIAFGGRVLKDAQPKYLNSPESLIFNKSAVLYGSHIARKEARKTDNLIVVEGYMDVIAMHQAGFVQTVAPLGTAVTSQHIEHMWKITKTPILCFDGDTAGQKAMARVAENALPLLKEDRYMNFVALPAGMDPDDIVKQHGRDTMQSLITGALYLEDQLYQMKLQDFPISRAGGKTSLWKALLRLLSTIDDGVIRKEYESRLYQKLFARKSSWKKNNQYGDIKRPQGKTLLVSSPLAGGQSISSPWDLQKQNCLSALLELLLWHPNLLSDSVIEHDMHDHVSFESPELDKLCQAILELKSSHPTLLQDKENVREYLKQEGFSSVLEKLFHQCSHIDRQAKENEGRAQKVWHHMINHYQVLCMKQERASLSEPFDEAKQKHSEHLLSEIQRLELLVQQEASQLIEELES